jgi:hypothetical protein
LRDADVFPSQDCYILGFPLARIQNVPPEINWGYPIPIVAKGVVGAFNPSQPGGAGSAHGSRLLVSALATGGFSGGPILIVSGDKKPPQTIGVISFTWRIKDTPADLTVGFGADEILKVIA